MSASNYGLIVSAVQHVWCEAAVSRVSEYIICL